jgi:hypothetical protein
VKKASGQTFAKTMLCNIKDCSSNHYDHVFKVVFTDPTSTKHWHAYIVYIVSKLGTQDCSSKRKDQLVNLVQLSLDCTQATSDKDESYNIRLHLLKAARAKYAPHSYYFPLYKY